MKLLRLDYHYRSGRLICLLFGLSVPWDVNWTNWNDHNHDHHHHHHVVIIITIITIIITCKEMTSNSRRHIPFFQQQRVQPLRRAMIDLRGKAFLSDPCAHGIRSLGHLLFLSVSMRGFWNLVKTVNVVNVDTLVDDPSEDLSWRP